MDIPQSFSPKGDGINDTFRIPGLEDFPGNEIRIYNRWGAQLYHANNCHQERGWDGSTSPAFGNGPCPPPPTSTSSTWPKAPRRIRGLHI
ncbi:MAG: gliding motility-associated C-terminal domain-containing protein [Flavobacteriales bacterium]